MSNFWFCLAYSVCHMELNVIVIDLHDRSHISKMKFVNNVLFYGTLLLYKLCQTHHFMSARIYENHARLKSLNGAHVEEFKKDMIISDSIYKAM